MYKLNFNHLHYFLTISEEGSIVKAAKKLNMTQPSLSHQLKLLEQDLGKKLFDRVGRSLQLNSEGYLVKDYAMSIFRQTEEMLEVVKSQVSHKIKIIKIGAVSWLSKDQIYEIIKPLIFSPYVKIILKTAPLEELLRELNGNKLDLIFCDSPYSGRYRKLTGHKIYSDPIYCVSHKKSKPKGRFPKCLEGQKLLNYPPDCQMAENIEKFIKLNNIDLEIIGEFNDSSFMRVATENGGIISFLPKSIVKESLKSGNLVKVGEIEKLSFNFWIITHKSYKKDSLIAKILKNKS